MYNTEELLEKNEINGDELKHLLSEREQKKINFLLIDVREEYEYNEKRIIGTDYLTPLSDFFNKVKQTQLKMMDFNNVINLSGGITYYNGKTE